jgi:hypothetical protein
LNFSLFLHGRANFSLYVSISHFVATAAPISHFRFEFLTLAAKNTRQFLIFGLNFSLFHRIPHISITTACRAAESTRRECQKKAANVKKNMANTMMVATTFMFIHSFIAVVATTFIHSFIHFK